MDLFKFLRKYRFEAFLILLAGIAILLLIGDANLHLIQGAVDRFFQAIQQFFDGIWERIRLDFSMRSPVSLIAIGLLGLVSILIPWRIRLWIANAPRFNVRMCPRCGRKLHRARRKFPDRMLAGILVLALRRYKCVDETCGWHGLVTAKSRQAERASFVE